MSVTIIDVHKSVINFLIKSSEARIKATEQRLKHEVNQHGWSPAANAWANLLHLEIANNQNILTDLDINLSKFKNNIDKYLIEMRIFNPEEKVKPQNLLLAIKTRINKTKEILSATVETYGWDKATYGWSDVLSIELSLKEELESIITDNF